uniref:Uncharacterized protein n=1 Tax=Monopterus albus TaxID=43700 RepID=A0A3Q3IHU9_MONAL
MAQRDSGAPPSRRNIKLESFLKRNTERDVFERIRTYEPCVVIAEPLNKVYMHVVLTDEQVYLTEHAPRTLTAAVSFRRVRDIELVNDLPDFLSGKDREHCQHIRITYVPEKPSGKGHDWFSRDKEEGLPLPAASSHRSSYCPSVTHTSEGTVVLTSLDGGQVWTEGGFISDRTAYLFSQLSSELLQDGISVESMYVLLQELRTAAHHSITLRRLFWRSSEVCVFLVQTLEETLQGCRSHGGVYTADQLLSTLIVQTFVIMFREMEIEAARINLLSLLQSSVCVCRLQALLSEYLDAACSLLFELLLLGHESSRCSSAENFLSFGWILGVLQPHPHLLSFIDYQAQQTVLVLSDPEDSVPSPLQSVLLFQRCRLLLACLQYNFHLAQHLRSHFREEFRYSVKPSCAEEKLPACYLISRPTVRLVKRILALILHR